MASRLVNVVALSSPLYPGDVVPPERLAEVQGAGGFMVSDANPAVLTAAELTQSLRLAGRLSASDLAHVMLSVVMSYPTIPWKSAQQASTSGTITIAESPLVCVPANSDFISLAGNLSLWANSTLTVDTGGGTNWKGIAMLLYSGSGVILNGYVVPFSAANFNGTLTVAGHSGGFSCYYPSKIGSNIAPGASGGTNVGYIAVPPGGQLTWQLISQVSGASTPPFTLAIS